MELPELWLQHEVTAEPYAGTTGQGVISYGTAVAVQGFQLDKRRLVRSATTGKEVVSETTFYCRLDSEGFTPEGRVTLADGRQTTVINVLRHDAGDLPLPECLEVVLA